MGLCAQFGPLIPHGPKLGVPTQGPRQFCPLGTIYGFSMAKPTVGCVGLPTEAPYGQQGVMFVGLCHQNEQQITGSTLYSHLILIFPATVSCNQQLLTGVSCAQCCEDRAQLLSATYAISNCIG